MSSAVEFVEGGVQDACEDACSICLETFSDQDPASVTDCNHEYHLQCILEWSQRSTECPMCWQALRLQDASSQELLASMEQERSLRQNRIQASSLPRLRSGDYEFHQFSESFEERLMQHFAAAVGHSHGLGRGSHRPSVAGQHPSQFLIFPTYSTAASSGMAGHDDSASVRSVIGSSIPSEQGETGTSYAQQHNASAERHGDINTQSHSASRQRTSSESASTSQFGASTSDLQSFSDTIRSRLAAVSSRYKESLTKTTRIFRERLRVRNGTAPDINVGAPEENPSYTGGGTAGQSGDTSEPFVHLTAEIAEATSTDIIPVHIANVEKNEDNVSPRDPGAIDASSQPVTNEVAGAVQDVTVRTSSEGVDPVDENKPIVSII
ncbi:hypothetical protein O6H91_01G088900 [Diphasiastrum complanatum]|uniref:Uncharacterized protein n=1 Tax=Diphasiastrum complanatum TaxID=34168 RepID=A0ACC2ETF6_DIPCM|nr:hypothetical protein O6H91_01G088900 [Diphasiastrum complanatum]